ncbi:PHP domain-containing protein [Aliagarivorans marinus]|uniref:PHP domain-containing protein n=1 Tax=Aliagarivorans marinus TaxID=561965 RepID=UPI000406E72F|nr:PHP domain-containing protein [Aliagarivorans marinus]
MLIDLHSHTTASDGGLTPQELVFRAENKQLALLAITDHDTTDGVALAQKTASKLTIVPGTEISTAWHAFDIHIVGLNIDLDNAVLQAALTEQREKREQRAVEMGRRLAKAGYPDVYEEAKQVAGSAPVTRSHFAKVLVRRGVADNPAKVFDKFLRRGNTGYVPNNWMSIAEAVKVIQQAGGQAVLAHPTNYRLSNKWLRKLVAEFASAGGDAIEVAAPQLNREVQQFVADLAEEHGLLASQGTDFHHPSAWRELGRGLHLPQKCQPIWQDWTHYEVLQSQTEAAPEANTAGKEGL